jgi:predicted  nucleic acid-binding Zn-ribbon protein
VRRGASTQRAAARTVKRNAARARAQKIAPKPRPTVRPATRPKQVMAKAPKGKPRSQTVRPGKRMAPAPTMRSKGKMPTASRPARTGRPAIAAAGAAAAAAAGTFLILQSQKANPEIVSDITSLESDLNDLRSSFDFSDVQSEVAELDADINHALNLLESARDKGYAYQADLEDLAYQAASRWEEVADGVYDKIEEQAGFWAGNLNGVDRQVQQLNASLGNASAAAVAKVQREVDRALDDLRQAENTIEAVYEDVQTQVAELTGRLTKIHWALTALDEATFNLDNQEDLVMAVAARWDKEGKDDPEGVLYLTSQRLVFERKEKIATKKVLSIATEKELVHEVVINEKLADVNGVKGNNKGVFGHQDFVEVDFANKELKKVAFHLKGQDAEDWVKLIGDAKSGKIEDDRATGSGLSYADLTGEVTQADIMAVQNEVNALQDEMMLKTSENELAELENAVRSLERDLADLRSRGYAVEKALEADIAVLASQWDTIKARSETTIAHQTKVLGEQMQTIQAKMAELAGKSANLAAARPLYVALKSAIASAEAQADAAEDTVLDQYDEYADEVEALDAHLDWVDWMLDAVSTASFQLLATESGVAAVEAVWERPGLEPENGVLFLTDQRLLWEDRVGDFELKVEAPAAQIESITEEVDEETGTETLVVNFAPGSAPVNAGRFALAMPVAEMWVQMIGRARAGDYSSDRAIEIDEADLERIRNAPQQCENCGAAFTAPILRGQTEITCEFCGVVTRI